MKRFAFRAAALVLALAAVGGVATYVHAEEDGKKAVVEGEMVDMKCWLGMQMPGGGKHATCALECAKKGLPVGIVDKNTGQTFTVLAPAPGLAPYLGKTVRITGDLAGKSMAILPEELEVMEDGKWMKAELPGGMM